MKLKLWVNLNPQMPQRLETSLDVPWNHQASLEVDRWLWYIAQEFEGVSS
jgi:hypothetical protein